MAGEKEEIRFSNEMVMPVFVAAGQRPKCTIYVFGKREAVPGMTDRRTLPDFARNAIERLTRNA